jgi:hypothetical protein
MSQILRVGGRSISFDAARDLADQYFTQRVGKSAYPAYDGYPGFDGPTLGSQDLLAVVLLNVSNNPVPVYYGLESMMPELNERLAVISEIQELADARTEDLRDVVHLFGVLEEMPAKHIRLTTLSKVLHRKRPHILPLFDDNIAFCYSECPDAPVPYLRPGARTKAEYRMLWLSAVQRDLSTQFEQWSELAAMAPGPRITPLRALDIIGWELGRKKHRRALGAAL